MMKIIIKIIINKILLIKKILTKFQCHLIKNIKEYFRKLMKRIISKIKTTILKTILNLK